MTTDKTDKTEKTDLLKFYRSEIKFESELLSNRLNSFIASQSFLLIAYGGSTLESTVRPRVPAGSRSPRDFPVLPGDAGDQGIVLSD